FFFFSSRRRHTRWPRDWSSDVCSSDLEDDAALQGAQPEQLAALEGSIVLLERLERQFPPNRLSELRATAERLAGNLASSQPAPRSEQRRVGKESRPRYSTAASSDRGGT